MPVVTYLEAIRQGIWEEMERDPSVFWRVAVDDQEVVPVSERLMGGWY